MCHRSQVPAGQGLFLYLPRERLVLLDQASHRFVQTASLRAWPHTHPCRPSRRPAPEPPWGPGSRRPPPDGAPPHRAGLGLQNGCSAGRRRNKRASDRSPLPFHTTPRGPCVAPSQGARPRPAKVPRFPPQEGHVETRVRRLAHGGPDYRWEAAPGPCHQAGPRHSAAATLVLNRSAERVAHSRAGTVSSTPNPSARQAPAPDRPTCPPPPRTSPGQGREARPHGPGPDSPHPAPLAQASPSWPANGEAVGVTEGTSHTWALGPHLHPHPH